MDEKAFNTLIKFLEKIPSIQKPINYGSNKDGIWWVKFQIDIKSKYAWYAVQEIGFVCNYLSINERLPSTFYPVSPPPYLNGGPLQYLSWIIETKDKDFKPGTLMKWLEGRLPNPVEDLSQWILEDEDDIEDDFHNREIV